MGDVFISYTRSDREIADRISKFLVDVGLSVFWDHEIVPGEGWDERIEAELEAARSVVVIWTSSSRDSRWVKNEARRAHERGVLIPVLGEDTRIPLEFSDVQCESVIGWGGEINHRGWMKVVERIGALTSRHDVVAAARLVADPTVTAFRRIVTQEISNAAGPSKDASSDPAAHVGDVAAATEVSGDEEMPIKGFTPETLVEKLQELGYRAKAEDAPSGSKYVTMKMSGANVVVTLYPKSAQLKTSIQLYCVFTKDDNVTLEKTNEFSKSYRYAKAYLDKDGDPVLESDLFVGGISNEAFEHALDMYESSLAAFKTDVLR